MIDEPAPLRSPATTNLADMTPIKYCLRVKMVPDLQSWFYVWGGIDAEPVSISLNSWVNGQLSSWGLLSLCDLG